LLLKEVRSGVNYWNIDFNSDKILDYIIDIVKNLKEEDRVPFFKSPYVQELVLKMAGFLAKTNHERTRTGYCSTSLSEYWGFLCSEPIKDPGCEEL
jgi:hypothetical protein